MNFALDIHLLSDATFGRGDGVPGLVDVEIDHDVATGLPMIRGRVLKGLLTEECGLLLYQAGIADGHALMRAAEALFGQSGSDLDSDGAAWIGPAQLPEDLRQAVRYAVLEESKPALKLTRERVLESLTAIRRQTANTETGVPEEGSLRSSRVLVRDITLSADIEIVQRSGLDMALACALLGACAAALRRGGLGRNRGRGWLDCTLRDAAGKSVTQDCVTAFIQAAAGGAQ